MIIIGNCLVKKTGVKCGSPNLMDKYDLIIYRTKEEG